MDVGAECDTELWKLERKESLSDFIQLVKEQDPSCQCYFQNQNNSPVLKARKSQA